MIDWTTMEGRDKWELPTGQLALVYHAQYGYLVVCLSRTDLINEHFENFGRLMDIEGIQKYALIT